MENLYIDKLTIRDKFKKQYGLPIDICIVTFNRLEYLKKCVWSIIASTCVQYRISVIDDISNDGTREWLEHMKTRGLIHSIILNEKPLGTAENFNTIIDAAESNAVIMANDDMYFYRNWDLVALNIMNTQNDAGVVSFYNYTRLGLDQGVVEINNSLLRVHRTGLGVCLMTKDAWAAAGKFKLPAGRRMGFFATNFCDHLAKTKIPRNKIYCPKPHYAVHMDFKGCKLNELDAHLDNGYAEHRAKEKHQR